MPPARAASWPAGYSEHGWTIALPFAAASATFLPLTRRQQRYPSEATGTRVPGLCFGEPAVDEVWDDTRRVGLGVISSRDLGDTTSSLSAKTEEVLLEQDSIRM